MPITVKIPTQLRVATGGDAEVEVSGGTVGEALDAVFEAHGDLRERGLDTPINEGDEVTILPAVAGG